MKRPDLSPAPWGREYDSPYHVHDANDWHIVEADKLPDARAIAALPDLLAALEEAFIHGNKRVTDAAEKALTKAGYTFDDSTTP